LRHDLHIDGHAFRLRPVTEADAAYIVDVRKRGGTFLNRGADSIDQQLEWLDRYFAREGDFYFVVETLHGREREGLVALYSSEPADRSAEWGRWVLRAGSNAAVESALLVYRCAFDRLSLARVRCRTLATNVQTVSFHDSCGLARTPGLVIIEHNGSPCPGIEHSLSASEWPAVHARLDTLASRFSAGRHRCPTQSRP